MVISFQRTVQYLVQLQSKIMQSCQSPFISHYLKDIYNKHPTLPKIYGICGIFFVLDYYNSIETIDKLQNKGPMQNTVMLFMISGRKLIYNNCR